MAWLQYFRRSENYTLNVIRWCVLSIIMGIVGGLLGAVFHHTLHFVTHIRSEHTWLIFLLPVAGLLTVLIYRHPKMQGNKGTNEIIVLELEKLDSAELKFSPELRLGALKEKERTLVEY